jgi:hypothetical protein
LALSSARCRIVLGILQRHWPRRAHTVHLQVRRQRDEYAQLAASLVVKEAELAWALGCVRSRTFSGPYSGAGPAERLRLAVLVAVGVAANLLLGFADGQTSVVAAVSVLVFNLMYDRLLSTRLVQHAMVPVADLANHSSSPQVRLGPSSMRITCPHHAPVEQSCAGRHGADGRPCQQCLLCHAVRSPATCCRPAAHSPWQVCPAQRVIAPTPPCMTHAADVC